MLGDSRISLSFVFGLVGGLIILAVIVILLPYVFSPFGPYYGPFAFGLFGLLVGVVSAVFVIVGATMGFLHPEQGLT